MSLLEKLLKQLMVLKKRLARNRRLLIALASVVVFITTYAMILPAISMDKDSVTAGTDITEGDTEVTGGNNQASDLTADAASAKGSQVTAEAEATAEEGEVSTDHTTPADAGDANGGSVENGDNQAPKSSESSKETTYLSGALTFQKDGYTVIVDLDEKDQIPEGTTLSVEKLEENSDEYKNAKGLVASARGVKETELGMDALNIALLNSDGKEVEPKGEVSVKIEADNLPKEAKDISVHHIKDSNAVTNANMIDGVKTLLDKSNTEEVGKAKVTDGKADVEFKTGSFSPFAVSWAEVTDADKGPLDVSNYITKATAQYSTDNGKNWLDITDSTKIPVTAIIKIKAAYENVLASELRDTHGGQLVYPLPSLLLDPHVEGMTRWIQMEIA